MRILYIHQYFKTPNEPGGTRSYWVSKELIRRGHQIIMLAAKADIPTKVYCENIGGIHVIYLKVPYDQKMSIWRRLTSFVFFMLKAIQVGLKLSNINLTIATSTPLTVGFPALLLHKLKGIPYIFEVRDLWPEVPIQMGGIKNPLLIRFARWIESILYKNAIHIIALSPGMVKGILSRKIPQQKVTMIPNMAKVDVFYPRIKDLNLLQSFGLKEDSFKVVHFGSLGLANGTDYIIDAAVLLKENTNIEFVFIGGGATEEALKKRCMESEITNVHFLGKFPMSITSEIVNFCDVSIVTFLNLPVLRTNSPNKLFDSLSAGKPIIVNSDGWTKFLVERYKCGLFVKPDDPHDLVEKLMFLSQNTHVVEQMGHSARNLAEEKFDKSIQCDKFAGVVDQLFGH